MEFATARRGESELEDRSGQRVSHPTISCSPDASSPCLLPVTASSHRQLVDFHCACLPRSLPIPLSQSFGSKSQALSTCWGEGGISISEPGGTFSVSENNPTSPGAALESKAKLNSHQVNGYKFTSIHTQVAFAVELIDFWALSWRPQDLPAWREECEETSFHALRQKFNQWNKRDRVN